MRPGRQVESVPTFFCQRRAFNLPKRTGEHEAMRKIITHKQAKALGLKRYFTGEPCKHGHIAERLTNCRGQCVECNRAQDRKRYAANPEKKLAKKRRRYAVNPEKYLAQNRKWYAANRERIFEQKRKQREKRLPTGHDA